VRWPRRRSRRTQTVLLLLCVFHSFFVVRKNYNGRPALSEMLIIFVIKLLYVKLMWGQRSSAQCSKVRAGAAELVSNQQNLTNSNADDFA
jgi:hypothetical protein